MTDCIFCKIVKGEIDSAKIWEDENFLAFLDANPKCEGHTLIIPKKHFDNLESLDIINSSKCIEAIQEIGKILMQKYDAEGFNLLLNNGEVAGQIVEHVHFHLLPRKEGDDKKGIIIG